jgi:uncharacterized protein YutD
MKKEISPEMYNYNKFPGPSFARIGNKVVSENIELNVVDDFKDAFDQTAFGQRFSPIMLKFDYIIGDWGNEQLRLKGFYRDEKPVKSDLKIGRLDDYLTEYCNFGCAYFVLENPNPQELEEEPEEKQVANVTVVEIETDQNNVQKNWYRRTRKSSVMNQNDLSQLQILQRTGPSFYRK